MRMISYLALGLIAVALCGGALAGTPTTLAGTLQPTTIDVPGASGTRAYGINSAGNIVGYYVVSGPGRIGYHGFLWANGRFTPIDVPASYGTMAYGINAAGQIVGVYWDRNGAANGSHGFLYAKGRFTPIDVPGAVNTMAYGINDQGQIVGVYTVRRPSGIPGWPENFGDIEYQYDYGHGFLYGAARVTRIDAPGARRAEQTKVRGINAAGQIVGDYVERAAHNHGFVVTKGQFSKVDAPEASSTSATGINAVGQVVGNFTYKAYWAGFLLTEGHFTNIDFKNDISGSLGTQAEGINDRGWIVGYYQAGDHGLHDHGFVLKKNR